LQKLPNPDLGVPQKSTIGIFYFFKNKIWADACARDFFSRIMKGKEKHKNI
jgi:hypothetical protein